MDLETSVLGKPTGVQDFYPAVFGGLSAIHHLVGETKHEELPFDIRHLEDRMLICFSGKSRFSGANNWDIFKSVVEGRAKPVNLLRQISEVAARLRQALVDGDLDQTGAAMTEEWKLRSRLAQGISTPRIERLLNAASKAGAAGGKACGAGGGGCLVLMSKKGCTSTVQRALRNEGGKVLPFTVDREGIQITLETGDQPELIPPHPGE